MRRLRWCCSIKPAACYSSCCEWRFSSSSSSSSSSSIGTTTHCGLWPVEQCPIFFLSATISPHLLTPSTWRSLSTSSFHLFLGRPLLLVPSISGVKIFLGILSSSIHSRWPNQLILCPFIHFTIFSPLLISSSSRFVRLFHSPFSYLGPYIRERRSVTLKCAGRPINKWWEIVWICCLEITDTVRLMYFFF